MKILHTSDWHLGQHFITKSRADEHQAFMTWLLAQIEQHQVDAVIVAGDIFDTGTPPSYARELYNSFVVAMSKAQCQLIILAGNHDSVATLNESKHLLLQLNTHVIASVSQDINQQLLVLSDRQGQPAAIVCAVPFVRPRDVMQSQARQNDEEKQQRLGTAITEHYASLHQLAEQQRQQLGGEIPIIATGHLTAVGVSVTESVRNIYIGSLEAFPASQFPAADYIALGHIHRAQKVAKSEHIRYSGSPIPLSFDEVKRQKSVNLVSFTGGKLTDVTELMIPTFQPMQVLKGNLASIEAQLATFVSHVSDKPVWLSIEVQEQDYLTDLQTRIETMTADLPVEVLQVRRARKDREQHLSATVQETLTELTVQDVFQRCLQGVEFNNEAELARKSRIELAFNQIVEQVEHAALGDRS